MIKFPNLLCMLLHKPCVYTISYYPEDNHLILTFFANKKLLFTIMNVIFFVQNVESIRSNIHMDHSVRDCIDNCKVVTKDGSLIFRYKSVYELLSENILLLNLLQNTCPISREKYIQLIKPLVIRFAKSMSVAPASKFLHDSDCGGLFRHSLLVALKAIELYRINKKMSINSDADYVLLIFLSLFHDSGKLLSDFEISANGIIFEYDNHEISYTLDDFLQQQNSELVKISYKDKRNKNHELCSALMLKFMLYGQNNLAEYLTDKKGKEAINSILFGKTDNQYYKLIKTADILACAASINRYSPLYEIGNYLKLLFHTKAIDLSLSGFYRINYGYVVERGSPAHQSIITAFDSYYEILNECKSFSNLTCQAFENLFNVCQNSLINSLQNRENLFELSYRSNYKYPKKSFFFELADSNFYVQGAYKRACIWRELYKNDKSRFVYGYILSLEQDPFGAEYSIVGEYRADYVLKLLNASNIEFNDTCKSQITSFNLKEEYDDKELIDKSSIIRDSYSLIRENMLKKISKQRENSKKKEKTSLNVEIKSLQNELKTQECSEPDDYWTF